jgi:hypothetical protein
MLDSILLHFTMTPLSSKRIRFACQTGAVLGERSKKT